MSSHEKRASTRYQVEIDMHVAAEGRETTGRTLNLSMGGALVHAAMSVPLRVGERVRISFRVPELQAPLEASAEIRWVGDLDESLVGLSFTTGFRAKEMWALGKFLERQTPI